MASKLTMKNKATIEVKYMELAKELAGNIVRELSEKYKFDYAEAIAWLDTEGSEKIEKKVEMKGRPKKEKKKTIGKKVNEEEKEEEEVEVELYDERDRRDKK